MDQDQEGLTVEPSTSGQSASLLTTYCLLVPGRVNVAVTDQWSVGSAVNHWLWVCHENDLTPRTGPITD